MTSYFLRSKHISRGKGARVTRAAAYRAGERIRDERSGEVYDHSDRDDVVSKEIVLPSGLAGREDMAWTQDRAVLWNAAEHAGIRRNSRLARELLVLLPPQLGSEQRARLVRGFSQELADQYRCAVDLTVHAPRRGADARNHHAHLLMTVREVTPDGMGSRTSLELGGYERRARGLGPTKTEYLALRERWAELTNHALRQAGLAIRVDHRSYASQGLNREPTPTIPEKVFYAERRSGAGSPAGDAIRARHRERVRARAQGPGELERVLRRQTEERRGQALQDLARKSGGTSKVRWAALTREERNALRRQAYRARREIEKRDPIGEARRREISRRRYHESFRSDPEAVRNRRSQYRKAHADEINRKQREYRRARSAELNRRRRELRRVKSSEFLGRQPASSPGAKDARQSPAPEDSARAWLADRQRYDSQRNAQRSAAQWRSAREHVGTDSTPENSARNWLAGGGMQPERGAVAHAGADSSRQGGSGRDADDDEDRRVERGPGHDLER